MINLLIFDILLRSNPLGYLEIKKCNKIITFLLNKNVQKNYKQQFLKKKIVKKSIYKKRIYNNKTIINFQILLNKHLIKSLIYKFNTYRKRSPLNLSEIHIIKHFLIKYLNKSHFLKLCDYGMTSWITGFYHLKYFKSFYQYIYSNKEQKLIELCKNCNNFKIKDNNIFTYYSFKLDNLNDIIEQKNKNYPFLVDFNHQKIIKNY